MLFYLPLTPFDYILGKLNVTVDADFAGLELTVDFTLTDDTAEKTDFLSSTSSSESYSSEASSYYSSELSV